MGTGGGAAVPYRQTDGWLGGDLGSKLPGEPESGLPRARGRRLPQPGTGVSGPPLCAAVGTSSPAPSGGVDRAGKKGWPWLLSSEQAEREPDAGEGAWTGLQAGQGTGSLGGGGGGGSSAGEDAPLPSHVQAAPAHLPGARLGH